MIIYCLVVFTLLFAGISFGLVWRSRRFAPPDRWLSIVLGTSVAVFIYHYGAWVCVSVYLRDIYAVVFGGGLIVRCFGAHQQGISHSRLWRATGIAFSLMLLLLAGLYYTGTAGRPSGYARLSLPFRQGTYFVFQGGNGLPSNVFHASSRHAVLAMDIVKLNSAGNRAKKIFSSQREDYEIYHDTLHSPCNGLIVRAVSDNPDNEPPVRKRGPHNTNSVLLQTDSFYVFRVC